MGSGSSTRSESPSVFPEPVKTQHHVRQASVRHKQPMPDPGELEKRFTKVLVSLQPIYGLQNSYERSNKIQMVNTCCFVCVYFPSIKLPVTL